MNIRKDYDQLRKVYAYFGLSIVDDVHEMERLQTLEKTLHRHAEEECNFPLTDRQLSYRERYAERAVTEVEMMLPKLKGKIFVNGDPSGYSLKIHDKHRDLINESGVCRDWGGYGCLAPSAQLGG